MTESATPSPLTSDAACAEAIAVIGDIDRALRKIETDKSAAIAKATTAVEDKATILLERKALLEAAVEAYCTAHRDRLLAARGKTIEFPTGLAGWRWGKGSIEIAAEVERKIVTPLQKKVTGALKKLLGFYAPFVAVKVSLSKTLIKAGKPADQVKLRRRGIVFVKPAEGFFIEPVAGELAARPEPADADA